MMSKYTWSGGTLKDAAGTVLASAAPDVLSLASGTLKTAIKRGGRKISFGATDGEGNSFRCSQASFTVARFEAICAGRRYHLRRTSLLGRERVITDNSGVILARTQPKGHGLEISAQASFVEHHLADAAFLMWCILQVDNSSDIRA